MSEKRVEVCVSHKRSENTPLAIRICCCLVIAISPIVMYFAPLATSSSGPVDHDRHSSIATFRNSTLIFQGKAQVDAVTVLMLLGEAAICTTI